MYNYIKVKQVQKGPVLIHCVQAPEDGEMTNAQIIETENKLLLVDTLQLKPHSDELKQYVESLGKPLDRIVISHAHPDHWIGAVSFKEYPVYAFKEIIETLNQTADYLIGYHRSLHPDNPEAISEEKHLPTELLEPGTFEFDGVTLNFIKIVETECPVNMVVEIPQEHVLIAQDMVYNKAYPYFGERTSAGEYPFDNWIAVLEEFETKGYTDVLPGHGDPTDSTIFETMIGYLEFVKEKIHEGLKGEELITSIKSQYPDYGLVLTLNMSNYMLFIFNQ